jgi:hypothetical protein
MSLDMNLLEKVRELGNGIVQARCPACAERGGDRAGEHLRVYADGRFGCCVHPKDHEHRKRIFALAGDKKPRSFTVKVVRGTSATKASTSVKSSFTGFSGTPGTGKSGSAKGVPAVPGSNYVSFGTLGTPISDSRAHAGGNENDGTYICKDSENAVPSVPDTREDEQMPYLLPSGNLFVPFNCPPKYRWWAGGQSYGETLQELRRKSGRKFPNERTI